MASGRRARALTAHHIRVTSETSSSSSRGRPVSGSSRCAAATPWPAPPRATTGVPASAAPGTPAPQPAMRCTSRAAPARAARARSAPSSPSRAAARAAAGAPPASRRPARLAPARLRWTSGEPASSPGPGSASSRSATSRASSSRLIDSPIAPSTGTTSSSARSRPAGEHRSASSSAQRTWNSGRWHGVRISSLSCPPRRPRACPPDPPRRASRHPQVELRLPATRCALSIARRQGRSRRRAGSGRRDSGRAGRERLGGSLALAGASTVQSWPHRPVGILPQGRRTRCPGRGRGAGVRSCPGRCPPGHQARNLFGSTRPARCGLATSGSPRRRVRRLTRPGIVVGTPRYLAPERFDGDDGPAGDVYALGATLYEC